MVLGGECSLKITLTVKIGSNIFLKILTERAVTTETESLFQYLMTLDEKADPFLRRWLLPCSIL